MKIRRFLDLRAPIFALSLIVIMALIFGIAMVIDRSIKRVREKNAGYSQELARGPK